MLQKIFHSRYIEGVCSVYTMTDNTLVLLTALKILTTLKLSIFSVTALQIMSLMRQSLQATFLLWMIMIISNDTQKSNITNHRMKNIVNFKFENAMRKKKDTTLINERADKLMTCNNPCLLTSFNALSP